MKRWVFPSLAGLALLAWAQSAEPQVLCGGRWFKLSEVPVLEQPPALEGWISPASASSPTTMTFAVEYRAGQGTIDVFTRYPQVEIEHRWEAFTLPGRDPYAQVWRYWTTQTQNGVTTWRMDYPMSLEAQGNYTLAARLVYCYRTDPKATQVYQQAIEVHKGAFAYFPLHLSGPKAVERLAWLIDQESRRYGKSLEILVIGSDLAQELKAVIDLAGEGGFYNCNGLGICEVRYPAKSVRVYTDNDHKLRDLIARGTLNTGLFWSTPNPRDGRVWNMGPEIRSPLVIVSGLRHDYLAYGPGLLGEGEAALIETPKGTLAMFRRVLLLAGIEEQAEEVH